MGFAGGERDYRTAGFSFASGADNAPTFGKSLVSTFEQFPFARVRLIGPAWELRQVVDHVRFTVGLQKPFASFLLSDAQSTAAGGSSVITRSLSVWELRFGLGTEYRFGPVTPFIDLSGQLEWLGAELTVNDGQVSYKAQTFSLMVRAGARIQLSPLVFIAPSAEIGVLGNVRWGAQLMVGVTLPYD